VNNKRFINSLLVMLSVLACRAEAAAPFDPETQPLGYIGPIELSNTDLSNGAKAYRGWFENGAWQGDLIEYDVSNTGVLSTSIDLTSTSPKQGAVATNWSAHVQFAANANGVSHWDTGRKIITSNSDGDNQVAFRWANLNNTQKQLLDKLAFTNQDTSSMILDFLRGDRSQENPKGPLRLRFTVMGDVVHSHPEYVGIPNGVYTDTSYVNFKNNNLNRAPRVYVGSNDGMLHAFDASNGNEVWAYVPSMLFPKLARLSGVPYAHSYYVDGGITAQDAYYNGDWHTVLVGSMGAGARGLFALDVTSPNLGSENSASGTNRKILWELDADADNDKDMGYIFEASTIAQLNDGKFYAVNGNGVSSKGGVAMLYLKEIDPNGDPKPKKLTTSSGSMASPNGLSAPALVDTDNDGKVDVAWAGDINGDMWRFDLSSSNPNNWKVDYKVYDGVDSQPITTSPDIANHPQYGHLVLFGTGRLYTDADIKDTSVQSLFGIWDTGNAPTGSEPRLAQILSDDTPYNGGGYSEWVRTYTTVAALDYSTYRGWKVDLPAGERLLTGGQIRGGRFKTTITDPDGFFNWLHEATFDEGGVEDDSIFDLNRDALLNVFDRVDANADGDLDDPEDIPMGWERERGNMSQATIGNLGAGVDTLFLNFLNPPLVPPACSGTCAGGLTGGHMDVDTDSGTNNGLGGKTNGHVHEYDDKFDVTYVDYFNIDRGGNGNLTSVDEVGIDPDEEFIVLVANADMSIGARLSINNKVYNAVEYQRIIHMALQKWDGVGPLLDPDGDSLIYTLNQITSGGGKLEMDFDSLAIIGGGLHPTQTGCVNKTENITNGRWRNGSLIFHLVKKSIFAGLGGASALDRVVVQNPSDLKPVVVLADGTEVKLTEDLDGNGSIDGTSPAYEIFGGLLAKSNAEFLYESTVFWHFGDISSTVLGVKPCYGDPEWQAAFEVEIGNVSDEVFNDLLEGLGFDTFEELAQRVEDLQACGKDKKCRKQLKKLKDLYELGLMIEANKNNGGQTPGGSTGGGGSISGTPVVIEGGVSEGGVTSGPNFETGRRTWIDIMPE